MGIANVPLPPSVARSSQKAGKDFPAMYWPPEGEPKVFNTASEVPAGWTPYHPANAPTGATEAAPSMTKKEVVAALKQGDIAHDPKASHESLYALLLSGVKTALTDSKIAFDDGETDVKKLLGLFPTS